MSAAADFKAALQAWPGLVALVADRISLNAAPQGTPPPHIVFAGTTDRLRGLDNSLHASLTTFETQCWADGGEAAEALADEVEAALLAIGVVCLSRTSSYDPDMSLDGVILAVEWWDA